MYTSNIFKGYTRIQQSSSIVSIQIGNSADPENHHVDLLKMLQEHRGVDMRIVAPLMYGDPSHARYIATVGAKLFGKQFIALTEFVPNDKYLELLGSIDIAIFYHRRQQGMGNAIALLGMGKKLYMRTDITPWHFFQRIGIKVFDINELDLSRLDEETKQKNMELVRSYFTAEKLATHYRRIFGDA
jgi:hypothetical protein